MIVYNIWTCTVVGRSRKGRQ